MALAANALTSVASLRRYMQGRIKEVDFLRLYHDGSGGVASATVAVTGAALVLTTNLGANTLLFSTYDTLDELAAAADALAGWVVVQEGASALSSADLAEFTAIDALASANERYLRGTDALLLEDAINEASAAIEEFTGRTFKSTSYRHAVSGSDHNELLLRHFPIVSVAYIAVGREAVASIKYTSTSGRRAMVSNDGTNLTLVSVGASTITTSIALAGLTLATLQTAVNAVAGWTMTGVPTYGTSWPVSELLKLEACNSLNVGVDVEMPGPPESGYHVQHKSGIVNRAGYFTGALLTGPTSMTRMGSRGVPSYSRPVDGSPGIEPFWPGGRFNIIVSYTAGYAATPADVQRLCNQLAANIVRGGRRDTSLTGEQAAGYSWSGVGGGPISDDMAAELRKYIHPQIPEFMEV